jgi:acyl carrier protein
MNTAQPQINNQQQLTAAFLTAFGLPDGTTVDHWHYGDIDEWDSTAHMILVAEIENTFNVMLDSDDVIDLSSFVRAKEILSKYNIDFHAE